MSGSKRLILLVMTFIFLGVNLPAPVFAATTLEKQKALRNKGIKYFDIESCSALQKTSTTTSSDPAADDLKGLAKQMLAESNIIYWAAAPDSPAADWKDRVPSGGNKTKIDTKDVVQALSEGKKAYTTAGNAPNKDADLNPQILKFIIEVGKTKKIMVNALTDKTHTAPTSNHYQGLAVDLDVDNTAASIPELNAIATKYGGVKNNEGDHHHYDFISKEESASGGPLSYKAVGNIPEGGKTVGASIFGGTYKDKKWLPTNKDQDPEGNNGPSDDPGIGNRDNKLAGTASYAELSNGAGTDFSALGDLPNGTKLAITHKGKTVVAEKNDVGAGGDNVKGKPRSIDLWWELAKVLNFEEGTDVVKINGVAGSTPLTPVDGQPTDENEEATDATGECACPGNGGSGDNDASLSGSDNIEKALNFFIDKGFSPPQSAGIIGNFIEESGVNPKAVEKGDYSGGRTEAETVPAPIGPDGQPGYGIAQWTSPGRKTNLTKFAQEQNKKVSTLGLQLAFVIEEMKAYPGLEGQLKAINGGDAVTQSAFLFHKIYEGSADGIEGIQQRANSGKNALTKYGSGGSGGRGAAPDGAADTSACSTASEDGDSPVTGEFSLPLAKKWYTQNPGNFTKPHHDYPAADIPVPVGTPVYSMTDGKVAAFSDPSGCGRGVMINKGNVEYLYCHGNDGQTVRGAKPGDTVKAGQLIMHAASTGSSTGPHLHLQIKINGEKLCPQKLFVGIVEGNPPSLESLPKSGCTN